MWVLSPTHAVHHVRARLLELARALDVRALVEARLQLDQRHDLLAARGRAWIACTMLFSEPPVR